MTDKQSKSASPARADRLGRTGLHYAAADGDVERLNQLLAAGVDASAADKDGRTSLHFACQSGVVQVVRSLVAAGVAVDAQDANGNTPLGIAVFNSGGKGEIIAALRADGADPRLKNRHGVSPLSLARTIANYDVRQFFHDLPED